MMIGRIKKYFYFIFIIILISLKLLIQTPHLLLRWPIKTILGCKIKLKDDSDKGTPCMYVYTH